MDVYIVLFFFGGEGECRGFNAVCDGGDSGSGRCHGLPMHARNRMNSLCGTVAAPLFARALPCCFVCLATQTG